MRRHRKIRHSTHEQALKREHNTDNNVPQNTIQSIALIEGGKGMEYTMEAASAGLPCVRRDGYFINTSVVECRQALHDRCGIADFSCIKNLLLLGWPLDLLYHVD